MIFIHTGAATYIGSDLDELGPLPMREPADHALAQSGKDVTSRPELGFLQYLDSGMNGSVVSSATPLTDVHVCLKGSCCGGVVSAVIDGDWFRM